MGSLFGRSRSENSLEYHVNVPVPDIVEPSIVQSDPSRALNQSTSVILDPPTYYGTNPFASIWAAGSSSELRMALLDLTNEVLKASGNPTGFTREEVNVHICVPVCFYFVLFVQLMQNANEKRNSNLKIWDSEVGHQYGLLLQAFTGV